MRECTNPQRKKRGFVNLQTVHRSLSEGCLLNFDSLASGQVGSVHSILIVLQHGLILACRNGNVIVTRQLSLQLRHAVSHSAETVENKEVEESKEAHEGVALRLKQFYADFLFFTNVQEVVTVKQKDMSVNCFVVVRFSIFKKCEFKRNCAKVRWETYAAAALPSMELGSVVV